MSQTEFATPKGDHKIVLKEYITGRDMRALKEIFLRVGKLDPAAETVTDIKIEVANEAENKMLELVVISVDGEKEGILEKILDMPSEDMTHILEEVQKIAGFSKKK